MHFSDGIGCYGILFDLLFRAGVHEMSDFFIAVFLSNFTFILLGKVVVITGLIRHSEKNPVLLFFQFFQSFFIASHDMGITVRGEFLEGL